jgi:hypothetical protein
MRPGDLNVFVANLEQLFKVLLTAFVDFNRVERVSKCEFVSHYNLLYQLIISSQNMCGISIRGCALVQILRAKPDKFLADL